LDEARGEEGRFKLDTGNAALRKCGNLVVRGVHQKPIGHKPRKGKMMIVNPNEGKLQQLQGRINEVLAEGHLTVAEEGSLLINAIVFYLSDCSDKLTPEIVTEIKTRAQRVGTALNQALCVISNDDGLQLSVLFPEEGRVH
jgi:hypothetical protein